MKLKFLVSTIVSIMIWPASIMAQSELIPMIEIPAGNFYMGTLGEDENYDEAPMHKVHISKPFKMGLTEVTNAQYELFCPGHKLLRGKNGFSNEDDEAVVFVTYQDAVAFCDWLTRKEGKTYRLPTEAEWEYACKAGRYWNFYMDDKLPAAWQKNQVITASLKPLSLKVAQTPPNEWGLYDMCGNVEEWCLDWYGPYIDKEQTDPVGYSDGIARVTRGGSHNTPVKYLRSANRMAMLPEDKHTMTGFRVVQAEYPQTAPLSQPKDEYVVSQIKWDWNSQCVTEPVFAAPLVYVHEPDVHSGTPFFKHNHQPALTWCDNGDLLAVWFSTNEEKGREMVVLSSRLRAGSCEWEKPRMFYQIADRNLTGTALLNDRQGTLYHINGVEAAGHWQNLMMTLRTSTDNGQTWSKPRMIAPEHTKRHQVIAGTSINYSASEFPPIDGGQRLVLMRLNEGPILLISFTEHPYRTPKEERGMMFTNQSGKPFKGYGMYAALSYDEGKTWPVKRLLTDGIYRFLNGGAWTQFFEMDENHAEPRGYLAGTQTPDNMIHLITSRFYYKFNLAWLKGNESAISPHSLSD